MSSDLTPKLPNGLNLDAVRAKLAQEDGKRFWQSIEQLSETKEYRQFLENEFPHVPATDDQAGINRREVLKFAAASAALAGLSACTKMPTQKIVPYVKPPEEIIPGRPLFYATAMTLAGVAPGLLVGSHMGRPHKIEGKPGAPRRPGRAGVVCAGGDVGLVRSGSFENGDARRANLRLAIVSSRDGQRQNAVAAGWFRFPDPDRNCHVSFAGGTDSRIGEAVPGLAMAPVRAVRSGQCARRREAGLRPSGEYGLQARSGGRDRLARRGFYYLRPGACALRAGIVVTARGG